MEPVRQALWYIESHFAEPIGLDDIAEAGALSRYHFSRVFAEATGLTVSSYLRGRRLTVAARALADGASDIQSVALDVGYGSHEAFTRAFRDHFGVTPESVRARASVDGLNLVETISMSNTTGTSLPDPMIREEGPSLFAGLRAFRTFEERAGIPAQWQRFTPHLGHIPGQIAPHTFGLCLAPSDPACEGFDYLAAVAVRSLDDLPEGLSGLRLARRRYAAFKHEGHVSRIGETCAAIFAQWAPRAGVALESEPLFLLERYDATFDPEAGFGGIEVWVPLKS